MPGISMVVKVFRPVTEIKKEQNDLKFLIKTKQKNQTCLRHKTDTVCSLFVFDALSNTFACISQSFPGFLHVRAAIECSLLYHMHVSFLKTWFTLKPRTQYQILMSASKNFCLFDGKNNAWISKCLMFLHQA